MENETSRTAIERRFTDTTIRAGLNIYNIHMAEHIINPFFFYLSGKIVENSFPSLMDSVSHGLWTWNCVDFISIQFTQAFVKPNLFQSVCGWRFNFKKIYGRKYERSIAGAKWICGYITESNTRSHSSILYVNAFAILKQLFHRNISTTSDWLYYDKMDWRKP